MWPILNIDLREVRVIPFGVALILRYKQKRLKKSEKG